MAMPVCRLAAPVLRECAARSENGLRALAYCHFFRSARPHERQPARRHLATEWHTSRKHSRHVESHSTQAPSGSVIDAPHGQVRVGLGQRDDEDHR
jgi:hypothetical protein